MQLDQGACGHEVAGRIQEHGIKWQTTRKQVDQRATCEPEPDSLSAFAACISETQQNPPQEPKM